MREVLLVKVSRRREQRGTVRGGGATVFYAVKSMHVVDAINLRATLSCSCGATRAVTVM